MGSDVHHAYLKRLRAEARRLVRRHRAAVEALAAELLRRQEMDRAEVEALVEPPPAMVPTQATLSRPRH